jgi:hypothetical protein
MHVRARYIALAAVVPLAFATTASATSATGDTRANVPQVAGDPTLDQTAVFPTNKQNEPTIAVDPLDANHVIAGSNDEQDQPPCGPGPVRGADAEPSDCSFFPGVGTDGIYTSSDGGATWTNRGLIDDQPSWEGAGVISDGDPVMTFGPRPGPNGFSWSNGVRAYYASLATVVAGKGFEYVMVSHSDDDGLTWSAPVIGTTKTSSADFNDKNWLSVDTTPGSAFFGNLYLTWTEFRSATTKGFGNEPVMVAVSRDGGATFGSPNQLSPAANNGTGNGRQGSSSTEGPDGTAYVAFEQGSAQVVTISSDGGRRWTRPAPIGPVVDIADPIPGANFRTDSFPTIAADPRPGSTTVYAAWATRTASGGRIVVSTSTDRGVHWSAPVQVSGSEGYAFFQGLDVAPNGRVDLAYQALVAADPTTFGTGNATIDAYAATKPAGGSWSTPVRISTASSDPAASAQNNLQRQFWGDYNTVVSTADAALFISTDSRTGAGCPAVDAYQHFLVDNGLAVEEDDEGAKAEHGNANHDAEDPSVVPAPPTECPRNFGNTDVFVARFTP